MDQFALLPRISEGVVDVRRAVGPDLHLLDPALMSAWPMDEAECFADLLGAIDRSPTLRRSRRKR